MKQAIFSKFKESLRAIFPRIILILVFGLSIPGFSFEGTNGGKFGPVTLSLLLSSVPLIVGTTFFSLGVDKSIAKIGEVVGTTLTKRKSLVMLLVVALLMGFLATRAEPDLSVLASRISPNGPSWPLIRISAAGVGVFLLIGILRIVFDKSRKYWLSIGYGLVFLLGCRANKSFFTLCFDAGGRTTGVVTVPFIISRGVGVATTLGGEKAEDDSFGFSGLCSLGTVLACRIFSLLRQDKGILSIQDVLAKKRNLVNGTDSIRHTIPTYLDRGKLYLVNFLESRKNVIISRLPIRAFFVIFNFYAKIKGKALGSVVIGFVYDFIGLVLFFLGAESGLRPAAVQLGKYFASAPSQIWLFLIRGGLSGFIARLAEPAVHVLAENVSEVSRGAISHRTIYLALCSATAGAIVINIIRVHFSISFVVVIAVLYLIALGLSFLTPEIYVGISIDAAGVATGTMASCFFMPRFIGYTAYLYQNEANFGQLVMENGFGVVGIMATRPIIAVELVGVFATRKQKHLYAKALKTIGEEDDGQIVHISWEKKTEAAK